MQCQAIKTAVYFLLLTTLLCSQVCWASEWKLEKQKNDVSIYSKETNTGYKEILVKTTVNTNPHSLIALLNDVTFSPNWIHNCLKVIVLDETSSTERLVHTFFKAPWPVTDRDMVTSSTTIISDNKIQIQISDKSETRPQQPKFVRMQDMHGLWEAIPLRNGKSEITYTGGGNPGGNLPTFIANKELITSMFKTFQNLNKVILLDKYQHLKISE
jgi:hypothetical protein